MNGCNSTPTEQSCGNLAPDLKEWVQEISRKFNIPEQQIVSSSCSDYGSVEEGRKTYIEVMHRGAEVINPLSHFEPFMVGAKPFENEKQLIFPLGNNISIRIWGDNLAPLQVFSLDFLNEAGKHIHTPPGVKIYTADTFISGVEVMSIEKSVEISDVNGTIKNYGGKIGAFDPDWETYLIPEGLKLHIIFPNSPDFFLDIPR